MKKLAIIFSIIILLIMVSFRFSVFAQPSHIPHENPAVAKVSLDQEVLLASYSEVFNQAATRQYLDAQSLLSAIAGANIADEIKYVTDRYNTLSRQLFTVLNSIESLLAEASTLFSNHQLGEAREKLDDARETIGDAQFLLDDIEAATHTLADNLGVFAPLATDPVKQAYEHLQQSLLRLRELINKLNQLEQNLELNPSAVIQTYFYYSTLLEVSVPQTAHPGLPITVSGQVKSTHDNVVRTVKVILDNTQLAEKAVTGQFNLEIVMPPQTATGRHSLTVVATSQERYAAVSKRLSIDVSRMPIQADIQVPPLVFTSRRQIQFSGKVFHDLTPVQEAQVSLTFRQSATTAETASDGSFTTVMKLPQLSIATTTSVNPFYATVTTAELPLDLSIIGPQELTITIAPVEPWYASRQIKQAVFLVNPASLGLMLVAFISFGLLIYKRVRTRSIARREEEEEDIMPSLPFRELPPVVLPPPEFTGVRGRTLTAYLDGLEIIEKTTGLSIGAPTTLREFLETATGHLNAAASPFAELTTIAEVALYSAYPLNEDMGTRAEQLAAIIKEELSSGPA